MAQIAALYGGYDLTVVSEVRASSGSAPGRGRCARSSMHDAQPDFVYGDAASSAAVLAKTPLGTVPVLETDDGAVLYDAAAIVAFGRPPFASTLLRP